MNKKRLLILGAIVVLSLGSLGVVQYLATEKGIEESEGGCVQNLVELSEDEQGSTKPSVDQTESDGIIKRRAKSDEPVRRTGSDRTIRNRGRKYPCTQIC